MRQTLQLGCSLDLQQDLEQTQDLRYGYGLTDAMQDCIAQAIAFWQSKPHHRAGIAVRELTDLLGTMSEHPVDLKRFMELNDSPVINMDFVVLTPQEMATLLPDEKYGSVIGGRCFISEAVPEEYRPFCILNLAVWGRVQENSQVMELLQDAGIDISTSRHWTANFIDVVAASAFFKDDPEQARRYLEWRREIERTDFFESPVFAEMAKRKMDLARHRRTTPPAERNSGWVRRSWAIAGALSHLSPEFVDRNYRMLGLTKADVVYFRLIQSEHFDPNTMIKLLNRLDRRRGDTKAPVDLRDDSALDVQAGLLTEWNMDSAALLKDHGREDGVYKLQSYAIQTVRPLIDRICSMFTYAISDTQVGRELLTFMQDRASLELEGLQGEVRLLSVDELGEEGVDEVLGWLGGFRERVEAQRAQVEGLLGQSRELAGAFDEFGAGLPKHVVEDVQRLTDLHDRLAEARAALDGQSELVSRLREFRSATEEVVRAGVV